MPAPRTEYLLDRIRRVLSERLDSQLPAPRGPSNNCHVPLPRLFGGRVRLPAHVAE